MAQNILLLYRSLLKQANALPHPYIQEFYRIRIQDLFNALRHSKQPEIKLKRARKDLRRLERANRGDSVALRTVLDHAYGRTGKLRWELTEPFLTDPQAKKPPRLIPAAEKSRPPVYSPALVSLLTSSLSRTTKPIGHRDILVPPKLPPRADPKHEDARLLGRFSLRREVNIRWRFFTAESKKILPPLEMNIAKDGQDATPHIKRSGLTPMSSLGLLKHMELLAGRDVVSPIPKRQLERECLAPPSPSPSPTALPRRLIRRAYRYLLLRTPIIKKSLLPRPGSTGPLPTQWSVTKSEFALTGNQIKPRRANESELLWIKRSMSGQTYPNRSSFDSNRQGNK